MTLRTPPHAATAAGVSEHERRRARRWAGGEGRAVGESEDEAGPGAQPALAAGPAHAPHPAARATQGSPAPPRSPASASPATSQTPGRPATAGLLRASTTLGTSSDEKAGTVWSWIPPGAVGTACTEAVSAPAALLTWGSDALGARVSPAGHPSPMPRASRNAPRSAHLWMMKFRCRYWRPRSTCSAMHLTCAEGGAVRASPVWCKSAK